MILLLVIFDITIFMFCKEQNIIIKILKIILNYDVSEKLCIPKIKSFQQ